MKLRELTDSDAAWCAKLEKVLFPGDFPWSVADFQTEFHQPHTLYIGVESDNQLVGYAGMGIMGAPSNAECEIRTIGVAQGYQRRGIARMLMDNLIYVADECQAPVFLEVRTDNEPAKALYHAYGFVVVGVRKNYYQPSGADAFVMMRDVKQESEI